MVFFREQSTRSLGQHCGTDVAGIRRKRDILLSVQRLHCPGVFSKAKGEESCQYTSLHIKTQLIQFIALFFSVNQLVAAVCEEFEDHQDRTGEPVILMGQSIVLGEVKAEAPLHDEKSHE